MVRLFIYLLTHAQYKDSRYKGIEVKRGQIVVGRKKLANELSLSERQIRTCLNRLKSTNELTIKATNRYSVITIVKYDFYQCGGDESDQQTDQQRVTQATNKRPTIDHNTRNKERKKERNIYDTSRNQIMPDEKANELLRLMKGVHETENFQ